MLFSSDPHKELKEYSYSVLNNKGNYQDYDYIENIDYDSNNQFLFFEIKHYHSEPKISRYVTQNYERTPIYDGVKERTKLVKNFKRHINPINFLEEEIIKWENINLDLKIQIAEYIIEREDNRFIPTWLKKYYEIKDIENKICLIDEENKKIKEKIDKNFEEISRFQKRVDFAKNKKMKKSNIAKLIFGILLLPALIGIIILSTYTSKNKANWNIKNYERLSKEYNDFSKSMFKENSNLENKINNNKQKIIAYFEKIEQIKNSKQRKIQTINNGFINLKNECNFTHNKKIMGVYIVWNKTKDKYYVGQSKDVNNRIFKQHFKNGDVANIKFAKDWFNGDDFFYKIIECETKDELDRLEKKFIEQYNSFEDGYNSTSGNY